MDSVAKSPPREGSGPFVPAVYYGNHRKTRVSRPQRSGREERIIAAESSKVPTDGRLRMATPLCTLYPGTLSV